MPLSENEERILSEIEAQLYESDPALAREVGSTTVYTHALRNVRWALLGIVIGLAFMVMTLRVHFTLAFIGFIAMLASALFLERNARHLGKTGISQITQALKSNGSLRDRLGEPGDRLRERMRRDEDI